MADNNSSAMTMIVAIVALIIIVGIGLFVFRGSLTGNADTNPLPDVNVDLNGGAQ